VSTKANRRKMTQLDEVIPPDKVLWYIVHCILEVKPVSVAVYWPFLCILKCDFVYIIAERLVLYFMGYTVQLFTDQEKRLGQAQTSKVVKEGLTAAAPNSVLCR